MNKTGKLAPKIGLNKDQRCLTLAMSFLSASSFRASLASRFYKRKTIRYISDANSLSFLPGGFKASGRTLRSHCWEGCGGNGCRPCVRRLSRSLVQRLINAGQVDDAPDVIQVRLRDLGAAETQPTSLRTTVYSCRTRGAQVCCEWTTSGTASMVAAAPRLTSRCRCREAGRCSRPRQESSPPALAR